MYSNCKNTNFYVPNQYYQCYFLLNICFESYSTFMSNSPVYQFSCFRFTSFSIPVRLSS